MHRGVLSAALLEVLVGEFLVCPVCHQKLRAGPQGDPQGSNQAGKGHWWVHCSGCGRYYPVQDGIPVMLEARATFEPAALTTEDN